MRRAAEAAMPMSASSGGVALLAGPEPWYSKPAERASKVVCRACHDKIQHILAPCHESWRPRYRAFAERCAWQPLVVAI